MACQTEESEMKTLDPKSSRRCRALLLAVGMTAILGMSGCGLVQPMERSSFAEVLQGCRFKANGNSAARRTPLPATYPRVATCLQRAGWHADGTRLEPKDPP
jgi:hypothetical protein